MLSCVRLGDITSPLPNDKAQLDFPRLRLPVVSGASRRRTLMMRRDPSWDFNYTARREVTSRWLEEEEWLLRKRVL